MDDPDVDGTPADDQFVIDDVLHDVRQLLLAEANAGVAQADILAAVLVGVLRGASMEYLIPACSGKRIDVKTGQSIAVTDLEGGQVVVFFAEAAGNPSEFLSPGVTIDCNESLRLRVGDTLYTNLYRPMQQWKVYGDTVGCGIKWCIDNLSYKASHDELTGVYNRSGYDLLRHTVDLATTAFLLFDADKFKRVNDDHGHEVGDLALQKIAKTLSEYFRADDDICRIGGDEFMVLMVHITKEVRHLIESKVIHINEDLANTEDGLPSISVSAGVALCRDTDNPQELFHDADVALYYVKDHGRHGCCFYEPEMRDKPEERD